MATENLGFPLGALGFILLWRAAGAPDEQREQREQRQQAVARLPWLVGSGLFLMTFGLVVRAGAFFLLPALTLWAVMTLPRPRVLFASCVAGIGLGFLFNKGVLATLGSGVAFSDYPPILHGLLHQRDFTYLREVHPELFSLPVAERVSASYAVILQDLWRQPSLALTGPAQAFLDFWGSPHGLFSFVWINPDDHVLENAEVVRSLMQTRGLLGPLLYWREQLGLQSLLNAGAMGALAVVFVLAVLVSLFRAWRKRHNSWPRLLLFAAAGGALSSPLLPGWITETIQTQAVLLPFWAALPGVMLLAKEPEPHRESSDALSWAAPAVLAVTVTLAGLVRLWPASMPVAPKCGDQVFEGKVLGGTLVRVGGAFPLRQLETNLRFLRRAHGQLVETLTRSARDGSELAVVYDACALRTRVVVAGQSGGLPEGTWKTFATEAATRGPIVEVAKLKGDR